MIRRQRDELYATVGKHRSGTDQERINWLLREAREDRIDVPTCRGAEDFNLLPDRQSRSPDIRDKALSYGPPGVNEDRNARGARQHVMQEPKLLCPELGGDEADTCDITTRPVEARDEFVRDWIAAGYEDDRYRRRCGLRCSCRPGVVRSDHCHPTVYQIGCESGQSIVACCARAPVGHAATAPPSSATNSRRPMPDMGGPSLRDCRRVSLPPSQPVGPWAKSELF